MVLGVVHLLVMMKPSGGVHAIVMGKHCINSQDMFYVFNFVKLLQHNFPHTNLELQLKVDLKQ
jgi:hypothetical protein